MDTSCGLQVSSLSVQNYIESLVNKFFKILPMREGSEMSLPDYLASLQRELIGFGGLVPVIGDDRLFMSILSVLQFFIDNIDNDECSTSDVRREVFHIISMCNKLKLLAQKDGDAQ